MWNWKLRMAACVRGSRSGHQANCGSTNPRRATAGERAVVPSPTPRNHGYARADAGRQAHQKSVSAFVRNERMANKGAQCGYRAIDQSSKAWLYNCKRNRLAMRFVFFRATFSVRCFSSRSPATADGFLSSIGKLVQKLAKSEPSVMRLTALS